MTKMVTGRCLASGLSVGEIKTVPTATYLYSFLCHPRYSHPYTPIRLHKSIHKPIHTRVHIFLCTCLCTCLCGMSIHLCKACCTPRLDTCRCAWLCTWLHRWHRSAMPHVYDSVGMRAKVPWRALHTQACAHDARSRGIGSAGGGTAPTDRSRGYRSDQDP